MEPQSIKLASNKVGFGAAGDDIKPVPLTAASCWLLGPGARGVSKQ